VAQFTTVTLGPAVATDTYRPNGLPVSWTGYCPVASPSTATITAGNGYQLVNAGSRSVDVVILPGRTQVETIAAGATGIKHIEYGAVSQASFTFSLTVAACTDGTSGQGLLNVTVNSR
jgi:putative salt-induced outer membrane protein YdiY